ncbi:MAG: response regulator [Oceanospirillales bacterium]|nr:response regulator [Oceanospirillales bacterium]MBR9887175.1 response regulator [Oceanospirillales bacterium]
MKILLIEDGDYKIERVCEYINSLNNSHSITVCKSYSSALQNIVQENFDLAIIDMSLPTFDKSPDEAGGEFRTYGGLDLARQIKRRKINIDFLYLSQYKTFSDSDSSLTINDVNIQAENLCGPSYLGFIYYEHSGYDWKKTLGKTIKDYE